MNAQKFASQVVGLLAVALAVYAVYKAVGVFVDVNEVLAGILSTTAGTFGIWA